MSKLIKQLIELFKALPEFIKNYLTKGVEKMEDGGFYIKEDDLDEGYNTISFKHYIDGKWRMLTQVYSETMIEYYVDGEKTITQEVIPEKHTDYPIYCGC